VLSQFVGDFDLDIFEKNFRLQSDGILVPVNNGLMFYDFVSQQKRRVYEGDMSGVSEISFSSEGTNRFVYRNSKGRWELNEGGEVKQLSGSNRTMAFQKDQLWSLRGNQVFFDDEAVFKLQGDLSSWNEVWFEEKTLYFKNDESVWKVKF